MRICSLVPSGTQCLYVLGLGESIVGVSHECEIPPDVPQTPPRITRTVIDQERLSSEAIDREVRTALERGANLHRIDEEALARAAPDLVITQGVCEVCAVGSAQAGEALRRLPRQPQIVSLHPHTLDDVFDEVRMLGQLTGRQREAGTLVASCRRRLSRLAARLAPATSHPRVVCLEWLEPPMAAGHWVPEMVALAGGDEVLGRPGAPSHYVGADELVAADPDVLLLMPCGFPIERTRRELPQLAAQPWWAALRAVRTDRIFLVNGPAYIQCAGPRLIDGIEVLASLLHPEEFAGAPTSQDAAARV